MAVFKDFVGAAYTADSLLADAQSCINLFLEGIESGKGQNVAFLRETPGLTLDQTLPTYPIRGIWIGEGRMFVVAGAILYEYFANGVGPYTYGSVGAGSGAQHNGPVQIFPNGNQLMIVSAGLVWITGGGAPVQALYPNRFGDVSIDVTGLIVTWLDGTKFDASMVGYPIYIDTVAYTVASFTSETEIGLATSAGESGGSPYSMALAVTGAVTTDGTTTITWSSGMKFDESMVGIDVVIGNLTRTVAAFTDTTHLVLTASVPLTFAPQSFLAQVPVTASQGAFLDGVFIAAKPNSKQMNSSAIDDGTTWPLLNFASKQSYPDNINSVLADHEELYVFGTTRETEIWQTNPASQGFALARVPGNIMQHASVAPFGPVSLGEGIAFLGGTSDGWTIAYRATGFIPGRVSTHAIETEWASYPTTSDAVSFVYVEQGHEFWVITFPSGNATWVYDATAAAWHRRGWWNGTSLDRQRQMFHGFVFGNHYVGDWENGNIYIQSTGVSTDNGVQIVRQRAAPHLNTEHKWSFYNFFELLLDCATVATGVVHSTGTATITLDSGSPFTAAMAGLGIVIKGQSYTVATFVDASHLTLNAIPAVQFTGEPYSASYPARPAITLDWSDDGGYTWHAGLVTTPLGVLGLALRTIWRRLGRSRDRIFRVTWTASGKTSIVSAYVDVEAGA